jgi:FK506-binding protein 9/10
MKKVVVCLLAMSVTLFSCTGKRSSRSEKNNGSVEDTAFSAVTVPDSGPKTVADSSIMKKEKVDSVAFTAETVQTLKTPGGVKISFVERGTGNSIQKGDVVRLKYQGRLPDGKIFDSSDLIGGSLPFYVGIGMSVKGWDESLLLMKVGDKAKLEVPANLAYGKKGYGTLIPPNTDLTFDMEVTELMKPEITESGLHFYKTLEKKGANAKEGQNVSIHFYGWLQSGKLFDASHFYGKPYDFVLGKGKAIEGWNEALKKMKPGEKAILVVPPSLGYGEAGIAELVPPNSTLVYNVELISAK